MDFMVEMWVNKYRMYLEAFYVTCRTFRASARCCHTPTIRTGRMEIPHDRVDFSRISFQGLIYQFFSILVGIASRIRKLASKHTRDPSPEQLEFSIIEHQVRFDHLSNLKFGQSHFLDLSSLRQI